MIEIKNTLDRYLLGDEWDIINIAGQIKLLMKNKDELIDEALSIGGVIFSVPKIIVNVLENPSKDKVFFYEDFVHIISIPSAYRALINSKIGEDFKKLHYKDDVESLEKSISKLEDRYKEFLDVINLSPLVEGYKKVYDSVELNIIGKLINPETCVHTFKILARKVNAEKVIVENFIKIFMNMQDIIEKYMEKRGFDEKRIKNIIETIKNEI